MDDALPAPEKVLRSKLAFDLIWLSAVWMHVPPGARAQAFRKLVSAMSPGVSMMLTLLRHVVLNDRKSSTYKLALLRTVIRTAEPRDAHTPRGMFFAPLARDLRQAGFAPRR